MAEEAGAPAAASDINTPSESVPGETDLLIEARARVPFPVS